VRWEGDEKEALAPAVKKTKSENGLPKTSDRLGQAKPKREKIGGANLSCALC